MFIDSTWATRGVTQIVGQVMDWKFTIETGQTPVVTADARSDQDFTSVFIDPSKVAIMLEATLLAGPGAFGQWATEKTAAETTPGGALRAIECRAVMPSTNSTPIVSSTNASPIVVTATAHGYAVGDIVTIAGHLVNTAANGVFELSAVSANTMTLKGSVGTGIGGATGTTSKNNALRLQGLFKYTGASVYPVDEWQGQQVFKMKVEGSTDDVNALAAQLQNGVNLVP
jgi:hypothetical protein